MANKLCFFARYSFLVSNFFSFVFLILYLPSNLTKRFWCFLQINSLFDEPKTVSFIFGRQQNSNDAFVFTQCAVYSSYIVRLFRDAWLFVHALHFSNLAVCNEYFIFFLFITIRNSSLYWKRKKKKIQKKSNNTQFNSFMNKIRTHLYRRVFTCVNFCFQKISANPLMFLLGDRQTESNCFLFHLFDRITKIIIIAQMDWFL